MQTAYEIAYQHADCVIALWTEPDVTPEQLERAGDLCRMWLYLAERLIPQEERV